MNIPLLLSLLIDRTKVPGTFIEQTNAVKEMLKEDSSGLVDSLTDFMVESGVIDIGIETGNDNLNEILNEKWLYKLNNQFRGQGIETGIKGLLKEYLKERWRGASFPVLKIVGNEEIDDLSLPTSMIFVDGGSVHAEDKDKGDKAGLLAYNYYVGTGKKGNEIKGGAYFMYKVGCRWFDKYPIPFLIRRGVYKNWQIINKLKNQEVKVLDQIIPYIMQILKGNEALAINKDLTYDTAQLTAVKDKIQELMDKMDEKKLSISGNNQKKVPQRVTNFDEEIKHLIPDLENLFKTELFASAEKDILSGLGFIDIAEGVSVSRRESILNPKAFIAEVNAGIRDFKLILKDIIDLIKEKNSGEDEDNHPKYVALKWKIVSAPVTEFMTDAFLERCRALSDRGFLSNKTITELHGVDYELERLQRERELENGDDLLMYPKPINNQEDKGIDLRDENENPDGQIICECPKCGNQMPLPEGKHCKDIKCKKCKTSMRRADRPGKGKEKRNKDKELTGAPFASVKSLPSYIRKKFSITQQRRWMKIFNSAYNFYLKKFKGNKKKAESSAFATANSKLSVGKIKSKIRLNKASIEEILKEGDKS